MRTSSFTAALPDSLGRRRKNPRFLLFLLLAAAAATILLVLFPKKFQVASRKVERDEAKYVHLISKTLTKDDRRLALKPLKDPKVIKEELRLALRHGLGISSNTIKPFIKNVKTSGTSPPPRLRTSTAMPLIQKAEYLHSPNWKDLKNKTIHMMNNQTFTRKMSKQAAGSLSNNYVDPFQYFTFENAPFDQYALNVPLSQSLPLNRKIPDARAAQCKGRTYPMSRLHKVSIIVPFYNEMWAVLLRTIHSILDHSPPELLHEIIMVDDFSNFDNLLAPLTAYMKTLPKVRLIRLKKREGLIRSRMYGARTATGNLLAFIDAHVETSPGWLEPLVDLVTKERTTIAVPVVNSIDPLSFQYVHSPVKSRGIFTWDLDYVWKDQNVRYEDIGIQPHPSATMIGCSFLVDREFFFNVGAFDEGMDIWGGEQIEISFRTWMCGGSVKVVPCSHVGHIYRAHLPYAFNKYILYRNLQRIAEVWMDDYKRFFYYTIQADPHKFTSEEYKTVQARKDLRRKLQCKPFSWYIEKLTPDIMTPTIGAVLFGNIRNIGSQMCLFQQNTTRFDFHEVGFEYCSLQTKELTFAYMDSGQLMHKGRCLAYRDTKDSAVTLGLCDENDPRQVWQFKPGLPPAYQSRVLGADVKRTLGSFKLKYGGFSLCLSQMRHGDVDIAGALDCGAVNVHQFWVITYSLNYSRNFRDIYPEPSVRRK